MIIKSHLCGIAVAFNRFDENESFENNGEPSHSGFFNSTYEGRPQGSLYSQQKRKIADACEYMRINHVYKPRIFVATSPGYTNAANEQKLIQKLTHNLRNGYGCKNYVWVREFTKAGYPHFHFVADIPEFDAVGLSRYWSSLCGSDAVNSIRLGTAPRCNKCRTKLDKKGASCYQPGCTGKARVKYFLSEKRMCWYMTKYIGKSLGKFENPSTWIGVQNEYDDYFEYEVKTRRLSVSQELSKLSQPKEYKSKMVRLKTGEKVSFNTTPEAIRANGWKAPAEVVAVFDDQRQWHLIDQATGEVKSFIHDEILKEWNWQYTGFANTYKGFPKAWKLKPTAK